MTEVLFEIAHGKFRHREILEAEKKICQVLRYRILSETLIDRAHEILDQTLNHKSFINFKEKIYRKELETMVSFVSKVLLHDFTLCGEPL